jgi:hypothetical protein
VFCSSFWIVVLAKPNFNKGNLNAGQLKQQKIKNMFQELTFIRNTLDAVECSIHVKMGTILHLTASGSKPPTGTR